AALAAVRRRAVAGRGGVPGGAVQGTALALLHPRRGRGGAGRHQPRSVARDLRGVARELPAARDHAPEADDGGRRRALRGDHARRRRLRGDQPATARAGVRLVADRHTRDDYVAWRRATTRWADDDVYGHLNNAVYFELIDTAVNAHLAETVGRDIRTLPAIGVVAEVSCRYLREVGYPEPIDLGLVVDRVGTSSVVYRI